MKKLVLASAVLALFASTQANAATVVDAVDDFLPSYVGPPLPDLDVKRFSVRYNPGSSSFTLRSWFAGAIDPTQAGFYVIGVNTGTGVIDPFDPIGQGNVIFNQAVVVQKAGTGTVGATPLAGGAVMISGHSFTANVPLSLLPSTGFDPIDYGWNIWPRTAPGNEFISDFSPENATISAVPEPATWGMLLLGLLGVGLVVRSRATGDSETRQRRHQIVEA